MIKVQTRNWDKKLISYCYQIFLDMNSNNTIKVKERWEIETNSTISLDMWEEICTEAHLVTNANVWREFKWKVIMRFFRTFWEEVFETLKEVFGNNITMDPTVALLGLLPKAIKGRAKKYLLQILLTTAIKCITVRWLKPNPPAHNMWIEKIKEIHQMEKITYSLRLQKDIFTKKWSAVMGIL